MSAAVSMHEALFGRGVGAGAPLYQTFNAVVGASGLGVVNVPPLPAGTLIKVILPVNKGVWSGSAAGFSGGGSVSNMAGPNPPTNAADLSWATQVVTPQNTLASAHALQLDSVRTKPATGEYWLVSDGSQAEAIFTRADVATWPDAEGQREHRSGAVRTTPARGDRGQVRATCEDIRAAQARGDRRRRAADL